MDQPKIKNVYEKIGNLLIETINFVYCILYVFCISIQNMYFVLAYNGAKIAKQCKHCTKLELIYDFYQTRF